MNKLLEILKDFNTKVPQILSQEPTNSDEAELRLLICMGNMWMMGIEPISSEVERWIPFKLKELSWGERMVLKPWLNKLYNMRKEYAQAKEAKEGRSNPGGSGI